jgi:GntR family transcriptional regulator, transcriptional repressor for pyruvate dehydrogenase complex
MTNIDNTNIENMADAARQGATPDTATLAKRSVGIYERILELVIDGAFMLNSRLPSETELARQFLVSRPVVREALARLRDDGIVVSRRGSGSYVVRRPDSAVLRFVPITSIADIQRCFEFRLGLESAGAALAAARWERPELGKIKDALRALEACIAQGCLGVEEDECFHRAIAQASRNPYQISVQASLRENIATGMTVSRSLSLLRTQTRLRVVQDEHTAIAEAIEARDEAAAHAAMALHINNARRRMFEGALEGE